MRLQCDLHCALSMLCLLILFHSAILFPGFHLPFLVNQKRMYGITINTSVAHGHWSGGSCGSWKCNGRICVAGGGDPFVGDVQMG